MQSQDSIIKILDKLKFLEEIAIDSQVLLLDPQDKDFKEISPINIELILKMLEKEEIIEIHFYPSMIYETRKLDVKNSDYLDVEKTRCYQISIREKFDDFHNNLKSKVGKVTEKTHEIALWISYSEKDRRIVLNDLFILSSPNLGGINEMVFEYLYQNPNRIISLKELEREATREAISKRPHDIVQELGFKKDLRKAFFNISKTNIIFKNPVSKQDLDDLEIKLIKISVN